MVDNFDLNGALDEMAKKADAAKAANGGVTPVAPAPTAAPQRKLFQNKKANIAIGTVFGVFVVAIVVLLVI